MRLTQGIAVGAAFAVLSTVSAVAQEQTAPEGDVI